MVLGTSLAVQWLGLGATDQVSIPAHGTKTSVRQCGQKQKQNKTPNKYRQKTQHMVLSLTAVASPGSSLELQTLNPFP